MRIVITGASGNAGTALLRRLRREPGLELAGVVRRPPRPEEPYDIRWHTADLADPASRGQLAEVFRGADVVVHLAWQLQPTHDQDLLHRVNVGGARAVLDAVLAAGVPALVVASSVGVYAPGPKHRFVDESWPATGVEASSYSRHKVAVEAMLDEAEAAHPGLRVVRLRPGLIFQREAGREIARYFAGAFAPVRLLRFGRIPLVPGHHRLRLQAVHADDVADAYARVILGDARGAFNIAAGPVLTPQGVAARYHGRVVPVPGAALRAAAALSWKARLQPIDAGWVRLALAAPLLDTGRAERELGWAPAVRADTALAELIDGMARDAHAASPPMAGAAGFRFPGEGNPY
jgi:nucleoside-diphosphate-sugar epimerase